ncbi:MAG: alpha/beta fold hydrolase [Nonlabens sp.]|uniref:alpha/beta fold hydrolase n=1 Tax=Nonlabens sp. TaxID=1888209 RepID=UPI003EF307FF
MKNVVLLLSFLFVVLSTTSCSVLQWRKSDAELIADFKNPNYKNEVSYFEIDSLDLKVRIQEVTSLDNNINVVFFHGAPSSLSNWEGYLNDTTLLAVANMYAIDRPGYGYSNFGDEMPSIDQQARIFSSILKEKEIHNIIVAGSSYGGPIAARVAVLNTDVKAVMMISPAIDPTIEKDIWASRFTQWKLTRWIVPTAYRVAGDEKKIHATELALIEKDWEQLAIPVVHIHGENDKIVPYENVHFSKEHFPQIEIITIPEKGHEISYDNKELVILPLLELINDLKEHTQKPKL